MFDCIAAIDGTGPADDVEYEAALKDSHVQKVMRSFKVTTYLRGPDWWDGDGSKDCTKYSIQKMVYWCLAAQKNPKISRIWLTGYSRGAGAILEVCHRMKVYDVSIHGLILFDAVDMTNQFNRGNIPSNVRNTIHFTRNQNTTASRESFEPGTIGRACEAGAGPMTLHTFHCTHGGAGGAFFPETATAPFSDKIIEDYYLDGATNVTHAQDKAASAAIMGLANVFVTTNKANGGLSPMQKQLRYQF